MIGNRRRYLIARLCGVVLLLAGAQMMLAQAAGAKAKPPAPDLHAGGAKPSEIPNDADTVVSLPGFHLLGASVELTGTCKSVSNQVVSDNEIKLTIRGAATVEDKDDTCYIKIKTPGGEASTWIVVDLTDAQQQEQRTQQNAEDKSKADNFVARSGKKWTLQFAGGATDTYTSAGTSPDGMPTFQDQAGTSVSIAVTNDNTVTMLGTGCIRSGKLVGTQVKNGQSMGQCTPAGTWSATVEK